MLHVERARDGVKPNDASLPIGRHGTFRFGSTETSVLLRVGEKTLLRVKASAGQTLEAGLHASLSRHVQAPALHRITCTTAMTASAPAPSATHGASSDAAASPTAAPIRV